MATDNDEPQPAGFGLPAVFTNRFQVRIEGDLSRIVFGDALVGKHSKDHTQIIMRTIDLIEIGKVIEKLTATKPD